MFLAKSFEELIKDKYLKHPTSWQQNIHPNLHVSDLKKHKYRQIQAVIDDQETDEWFANLCASCMPCRKASGTSLSGSTAAGSQLERPFSLYN